MRPIEKQLWDQFSRRRQPEIRDRLIDYYRSLVERAADRLCRSLVEHVSAEDLVSAGLEALWERVESFDPRLGPPFRSYASRRITGAMLDRLRADDYASRRSRQWQRRRRSATATLTQRLGRWPTDEEVMELLGWDVRQWRSSLPPAQVSLAIAAVRDNAGNTLALEDLLADCRGEGPLSISGEERFDRLTRGLQIGERVILYLGNYCGCTQVEISRLLGVTESRISQRRKAALEFLRRRGERREEGEQ